MRLFGFKIKLAWAHALWALALWACSGGGPGALTGPVSGPINAAVGGSLDTQQPAPKHDPHDSTLFVFEGDRSSKTETQGQGRSVILTSVKTELKGKVLQRPKEGDRQEMEFPPCCEGQWVAVLVIPFSTQHETVCTFHQVGPGGHLEATVQAGDFDELVLELAGPGFEPPPEKKIQNCSLENPTGSSPEFLIALLPGKEQTREPLTFVEDSNEDQANGIIPIANPTQDMKFPKIDSSLRLNSNLRLKVKLPALASPNSGDDQGADDDDGPRALP